MNYIEFFEALQDLVKNKAIRQADLARALETSTSNLCQKFNNPNSEVTISDMQKAQNYFGVKLYERISENVMIVDNSKKRQFDENIQSKISNIGDRINQIQEKNKLSNEQMSGLLNISTEEYFNIINSKNIPDTQTLCNVKQNFKISIDWLLFGE